LVINAHFGQRGGVATTNTLDDAGLESRPRGGSHRAPSPENPEQQPFLGKQEYSEIAFAFDEATYKADAAQRARGIAATIDPARSKNLIAAGLYDHEGGFTAVANTRGNFGYARHSRATFTTTVRTADGTGSGWGSAMSHRIADINAQSVGAYAIRKAELSRNPVAIEPGNYTVILEPNAIGDLVANMLFSLARARRTKAVRSYRRRAAAIVSAKNLRRANQYLY
jgi:predicted Zn-dependent protease